MPQPMTITDPHVTQTTERLRVPLRRAGEARGGFLVVIHGPHLGQCIPLHEVPIIAGRSAGSDVQLEHPGVSRLHCAVWQEHGRFYVRDLGSTNGTLVNERTVQQAELHEGDRLILGEVVLKFVSRGSMEARYHEALYQFATLDSLTQLYNRRKFRELLEAEVARCQGAGAPLSLAFIDLDHFKLVNDRYGHSVGDDVLRGVAGVMRQSVKSMQVAGRLGGEEFAVMLPGMPLPDAIAWSEDLRLAIFGMRCDADGQVQRVSASLGVAEWRPTMQTAADLMHVADLELLRAKAKGRNQVCAPGR